MTLSKVKYNLKLVGFIFILITYTAVVFFSGKNFSEFRKSQTTSDSTTTLQSPVSAKEKEQSTLSSSVLSSYVKLCTNTTYSFEFSYPKDWFTTYNNPEEQCLHLAPFSFILPSVPDDDITPVNIKVVKIEEWEVAVAESEIPNEFWSIATSENLQINEKAVKKVEYISTGIDKPSGFVKVSYLIHNSKSPIVLTYMQSEIEEDIAKNTEIVEEIVKSLNFY